MLLLTLLILPAYVSAQSAQPFIPIHGCEWVPEYTPLTNFTLSQPTSSNTTTTPTSSISWTIPTFHITCSTTYTGPPGRYPNIRSVSCTSPGDVGQFFLADDEHHDTATVRFVVYEQCAADIYAFHYEADIEMQCISEQGKSVCVQGGDVQARVTGEEYLPPIRNPPPPPPSSCPWCGPPPR
jgi:hypothetical protein